MAQSHMSDFFPAGPGEIRSIDTLFYKEESAIFVVNIEGGGWILLSGNKKVIPVLAFNDAGNFYRPVAGGNPAFMTMLEKYSDQIAEIREEKNFQEHPGWYEGVSKNVAEEDKLIVEPLIEVLWGQGTGWNRFCPEDSLGPGGRTYVGCVAVAMAQALSVYHVPDTGTGFKEITRGDYGVIEARFNETAYKWDSMSGSKADDYNALLLFHCAVAVDMKFGPDGSSANTSKTLSGMWDYFKMSKEIKYKREWELGSSWGQGVIDELVAGRPLIYRGDGDDGKSGHAFNIDGVKKISSKGPNYFHVNWGWSGRSNGYYLIKSLKPDSRDYSENNAAVFGIQPYYYPTGISLSDTIAPLNLPAGTAVTKTEVIDEASDNEYEIVLLSDSLLIDNAWVKKYYLDNDSIRTGWIFGGEDEGSDTLKFFISDRYNNSVNVNVVLTVADTTAAATAIYDNSLDRTRIYPNPASGIINIDMGSGAIPGYLRIYSYTGILVMEISNPSRRFSVDTGNMPGGLYIFETGYRDGNISRKKVLVF